ncbi:glutaminyl-tRNA synthetase [Candidatus Uzinura diaspidicola str. ASNER]|uniref:Glutamine--tRNA ligase n=1 Tax=Candidatus Uzinura diaspidicola str. ASNER TaxID=1133592 RepID=L7VN69_9FLAO|nr:glutaminyl-tRNA synthetase [Candidatus Uzinura diaspidicola str. ASNER]
MIYTNISINFIEEIIQEDINKGFPKKKLRFRFPPEPNGYLHIGHAKSICLNFGLAKKYKAFVNLRFDDTNPTKEENIYVNAIKNDIQWLGFIWDKECYASDCFEKLYKWAFQFIKEGKAYIDEQPQDIILKQRKTPFEPGIDSPYRTRPVRESLVLFKKMKDGKFEEGEGVLRAKINMKSANMNLRDPIMFRILKVIHQKTKNKWDVYPIYDWAHGQSDFIEKISHSLCSLEFENHRPLYEWYLKNIKKKERSKQIEFARLNISDTIMSKRKLYIVIKDGFVEDWDDPRLSSLRGLRRKGYTPESIRDFCHRIGISKRDNVINLKLLESSIREQLNKIAIRVMVVLNPLKLVIENYPEDKIEWFPAENNQESQKSGKRKIPLSKKLYIEREDFLEKATKTFHRLSIGKEVRLKNAYIIKGTGFLKESTGNIIEISAVYDTKSQSGSESSRRKIKCTLHWVDAIQTLDIETRQYELLFSLEVPDAKKYFLRFFNHHSLKIVHGYGEPFLRKVRPGEFFQFQRIGYFCVDQKSSSIIFNRTVILRQSHL